VGSLIDDTTAEDDRSTTVSAPDGALLDDVEADDAFVALDEEDDVFESGETWTEEVDLEEDPVRPSDDAEVEALVVRFRDMVFRTGAEIGLVDVERGALVARRLTSLPLQERTPA
jgi:hypothetical protein